MNLPIELTSSIIAAVSGLGSVALAWGCKAWLYRRKEAREQRQIHDRALREDTGKIATAAFEGSVANQKQTLDVLKEMLAIAKKEAADHRSEATQWRRKAEEWAKQAEQNRLEYQAMKNALDEEQRRTSKLENKVACLERKLAERDHQIQELRNTLVSDYARKPSTPAPPPADDRSEDETPVIGRGRRGRSEGT